MLLLHMKFLLLFLISISVGLLSCAPNDDAPDTTTSFDRKAMLENYADNLIIPGYVVLDANLATLETELDAFIGAPSQTGLESLRQAFVLAWLSWQDVSAFEVGPAMEQTLRPNLNVFPTDTSLIEANITSGSYNLETAANLDAKGFPALDYLLYHQDAAAVVASFSEANRQAYLKELVSRMRTRVTAVLTGWQNGYRATFLAATGIDVGSSTSQLFNETVRDYEDMRRFKVGDCIGVRFLGEIQPYQVEGFFSGQSLNLVLRHLSAHQRIFKGASVAGVDGIGFEEHLAAVDGSSISQDLQGHLANGAQKLEALGEPLHLACTAQTQAVQEAYDDLQRGVVSYKSEASSALSILITYQDGDGD